ncbi:MAG: DUF362 domain-containing protein [Deltaproteobacteria bacterium]|jgi:uncharacterized protein (DUF362 family)|nr:DUF362 domain-containing protein [Deltaproteobacteria bacterium]MBW2532620.1 DUF362 domain-containing protein [Deltaproteobacteria bacterium]
MTSDSSAQGMSRRQLLGVAAATSAGLVVPTTASAGGGRPVAKPPAGMTRLSLPGKVVKIQGSDTLQAGGLWPKQAAAKAMLHKAMIALTGKKDLGQAFAQFVHKEDRVAIKPNGLGGGRGATMASNKELVLEIVRGVMAAGVPAEQITIFEQYQSFLRGTRVLDEKLKLDAEFPQGVQTAIHDNRDATMDKITVSGVPTRFVRPFTEATAVINVPVIKDHSLCGYTGALKNITHGATTNPQSFHAHGCSPQIAELYAQDVVKSRMVLHVVDGFKALYDGGPKDRKSKCRVPHHAVYASTDPVALDYLGWQVVDKLRKDNSLASLEAAGRKPTYIQVAADLGLGIADEARIALTELLG